MSKRVYEYKNLQDDFFDNGEGYELPKDYQYIKSDCLSRIMSSVVYVLAVVFGGLYCRFFLHTKFTGDKALKECKTGFFLYGNHTQPVGDVFIPALACLPKRIYTVVSPANYKLPVIGKILNPLGALPISDSLYGMKKFTQAMAERLKGKHPIIIYPEAHVWPYYTGIRPYTDVSFKYPEKYGVPAFVMTTTYQKRRFVKKPSAKVFIDGPFYGTGDSLNERAKCLRNVVYECMSQRSKESNCDYNIYKRK